LRFELTEGFVAGDEAEFSGNGEGGQIGIHPEFWRSRVSIREAEPKFAGGGRFVNER